MVTAYKGTDCSGFVSYVCAKGGLKIPDQTTDIYNYFVERNLLVHKPVPNSIFIWKDSHKKKVVPGHVGIVESVSGNYITVYDVVTTTDAGNTINRADKRTINTQKRYHQNNIMGYGLLR